MIYRKAALTGHVFEPVHGGDDRRLAVLQEEDDQQCQSVVVEQGPGAAGITCQSTCKCDCVVKDTRINIFVMAWRGFVTCVRFFFHSDSKQQQLSYTDVKRAFLSSICQSMTMIRSKLTLDLTRMIQTHLC